MSLQVVNSGCALIAWVSNPGGGVKAGRVCWGKHKAPWPSIRPAIASVLKVEAMFTIESRCRMKFKSEANTMRNSCSLLRVLGNRDRA